VTDDRPADGADRELPADAIGARSVSSAEHAEPPAAGHGSRAREAIRTLSPALIAAGIWRNVVHRIPVRYDPAWWSAVFPLGMYGVGAYYLGQADHLPIIQAIGADESWAALAAWALTFLGMLRHLYRTLLRPAGRPGRMGL
jgi:tellurite resistance protein TehA-like permease